MGEAVGEDEVQGEQDEVGTFSTRNIGVQVAVLEQGVVVEGLGADAGEGVVQGEQDEVGTFSTRNIGLQVAVLVQGVVVEGLGAGAGEGVVQGQVFDVVSTRNRQKCVFFGNSVLNESDAPIAMGSDPRNLKVNK